MTNPISLCIKSKGFVSILKRIQEQSHFKKLLCRESEDNTLQLIIELINSKNTPVHTTKSKYSKVVNEMDPKDKRSKRASRLAESNLRNLIQTHILTPMAMLQQQFT